MAFITNEYQDCIDFLNDCAQVCHECTKNSLDSPDVKERSQLIKSLIDCGTHAQMAVGFIARNSIHVKEMVLLSAHLAKVCAEDCEKFNDEVTKMTRQVCLETASICIQAFENK